MTHTQTRIAIVAALLACAMLLEGCGSATTAIDVIGNKHNAVDCTYQRGVGDMDSTEYKLTCTFEGTLTVDDESPLSGAAAGAMF